MKDYHALIDKKIQEHLSSAGCKKVDVVEHEMTWMSSIYGSLRKVGTMQSTPLMREVCAVTPDLILHKSVNYLDKPGKRPSVIRPQAIHLLRILHPLREAIDVPLSRKSCSRFSTLSHEIYKKQSIFKLLCLRGGTYLRESVLDCFMGLLNSTDTSRNGKVLAWTCECAELRLRLGGTQPPGTQRPSTQFSPGDSYDIPCASSWHCKSVKAMAAHYEYMTFPICENYHWVLCVYETKKCILHHFDSLAGDRYLKIKPSPKVWKLKEALEDLLDIRRILETRYMSAEDRGRLSRPMEITVT
jgi:hypothetical protein